MQVLARKEMSLFLNYTYHNSLRTLYRNSRRRKNSVRNSRNNLFSGVIAGNIQVPLLVIIIMLTKFNPFLTYVVQSSYIATENTMNYISVFRLHECSFGFKLAFRKLKDGKIRNDFTLDSGETDD